MFFGQLHFLSVSIIAFLSFFLLSASMIDLTFGIQVMEILIVYRLRILCSLCSGGKLFFTGVRNSLPTLVLTFRSQVGLNQIILIFCLLMSVYVGTVVCSCGHFHLMLSGIGVLLS